MLKMFIVSLEKGRLYTFILSVTDKNRSLHTLGQQIDKDITLYIISEMK